MSRRLVSLFPIAIACQVACASPTQTTTTTPTSVVTPQLREERATALVTRLTSTDFAGCREWFNSDMRSRVSEDDIRDVWSQAEKQLGAFKTFTLSGAIHVPLHPTPRARRGWLPAHFRLDYALTFERGDATVQVSFDEDGAAVSRLWMAWPPDS